MIVRKFDYYQIINLIFRNRSQKSHLRWRTTYLKSLVIIWYRVNSFSPNDNVLFQSTQFLCTNPQKLNEIRDYSGNKHDNS